MGTLIRGAILVSNFNNRKNVAGSGTTIVEITPSGVRRVFTQINPTTLPGLCPGGVGLTTALVILRSGWVIVGSLPTGDGTPASAQAGCLLVLDSNGRVAETIADDSIDGPWDMTALDEGQADTLFVSNALGGAVTVRPHAVNAGTILRLTPTIPAHGLPKVVSPSGHDLYFVDDSSNALRITTLPVGATSGQMHM
jgi:hypothetical protein